ncbi:teichoic acids export ABC transporter ATP-binding subunit TagH [Scopulibacillus cellulosilyticus]|uniref:Teichoic acids export ABC transporter ATP-binding subunit TagH n=1 Tax=Scopulibacillus cellulosilyticus TaxID=2665665 RepID=A0ABW2PUA3_9BACL
MSQSVIFENVTKKYKMHYSNTDRIKDILLPNGYGEDFYALQNINFTAEKGDVIGVIGVNGAGKSTLSNLIAGIVPPTSGKIEVKGQSSLIAIAAGLNNQLTGRENIELKCLMLGFNKKEIRALMPEIIEFADIGKFIDQPVKKYSSGMKSRLGFAISVNIDPDVLVIDEALSVGDQTFTDKCLDKMNEFKEKGKTIFFISHSIGQVKKFCHKALWLEAGEVRAFGTIEEIVPQYEKFLKEFKKMSKEEQKNFKQLVLEKRSKLQEQESQTAEENTPKTKGVPDDKVAQLRQDRKERRKKNAYARIAKRTILVLALLVVVLGGAGFAVKSGGLFDGKTDNTKTAEPSQAHVQHQKKNKAANVKDDHIRYIKVPSAYIHAKPNMDSEPVGMAYFGQAYKVQKSQHDKSEGLDWLKVTDKKSREGWVSSKTVAYPKELKDDKVAKKLDKLIGFSPSLKEAIPMIGKQKGEKKPFDYTNYSFKDGHVNGFTINLRESSISDVKKVLGKPQLKQKDKFIYHGEKYEFILTTFKDGTINQLTVKKRPSL